MIKKYIALLMFLFSISYCYAIIEDPMLQRYLKEDGFMDNCQVYFRFNEGNGTTTRNMAIATMTITGTLNGSMAWATGMYNSGVYFDGSNDYIDVNTNGFGVINMGISSNVTVSCWLNFASTTTGAVQMVLDTRDAAETGGINLFFRQTTGRMELQINGLIAADGALPTNIIGAWHHVVATYAKLVGGKIYIDGQDMTLNSTDRGIVINGATVTNTTLGVRHTKVSLWLKAYLDEFRIFNITLTQSQVNNMYKRKLWRYYSQ